MKPDLIIHPLYADLLLRQYHLEAFYNIILLDELAIVTGNDEGESMLVSGNKCVPVSVTLAPTYNNTRWHESGSSAHLTSYHFAQPTPLYRILQKAPRYVIWTRTDPLTVCATCIDRVTYSDLYGAVCRAKQWAHEIHNYMSIIVFDLDLTLINENDELLVGAIDALLYARQSYDYVVLWSHGSPSHVDISVNLIQRELYKRASTKTIFDLVLSNEIPDKVSNKNLLHLYNFFTDCIFNRATLVDDSIYNWTPEYDRIIIPNSPSLIPALPYL
nr:38K protein [Apis mellifera nudivirus]